MDLRSLWKELDEYETELTKETDVLKDVWVKIVQLKERTEEEMTM